MKRIFICIIVSFILIGNSQRVNAQDENFKALFIYNFTRLIEWPADYRQGNFVISVFGESPMYGAIQSMAQEKGKVNNQSIQVQKINSVSGIGNSHILFLPKDKSGQLGNILTNLGDKRVLVVTDGDGLAKQGACISFIKDAGVLKFEISKSNIEKQGLKVNKDLISLGVPVN